MELHLNCSYCNLDVKLNTCIEFNHLNIFTTNDNIKYKDDYYHLNCFIVDNEEYKYCLSCNKFIKNDNISHLLNNNMFRYTPYIKKKYVCNDCFENNDCFQNNIHKCQCLKGIRQKCYYFYICKHFTNICTECKKNTIEEYCDYCK